MTAALERSAFFNAVRKKPFGGRLAASQVTGMDAILDACPADLTTDALAYCLATTFHETAYTMQPIEEYGHGRGKKYGAPAGPWHKVYDGRGDVQLTWLANYESADDELHARGILKAGESLAQTPDIALRPDIAAAVMFLGMQDGWFTGKKLSDYFRSGKADAKGARRIINGTDKAATIAGYWNDFRAALVAAKHAPATPIVTKPPVATTAPARVVPADKPAPPMAKKARRASPEATQAVEASTAKPVLAGGTVVPSTPKAKSSTPTPPMAKKAKPAPRATPKPARRRAR